MLVNIHFMLINSPNCFTCLFSSYGLLIMVGGVGGDFSQTRKKHRFVDVPMCADACFIWTADVGLLATNNRN